jgi:hypothetical protein
MPAISGVLEAVSGTPVPMANLTDAAGVMALAGTAVVELEITGTDELRSGSCGLAFVAMINDNDCSPQVRFV